MRVLIACEFSGIVREAFKAKGHDVWSCDLLPTEIFGNHIEADVSTILYNNWNLLIAFPPCTHLAVSGAAWFKYKRKEQKAAIDFVHSLYYSGIPQICVENPIGVLSTRWRKPDQIIQPYYFGHSTRKSTCLWLKNLPLLQPTNIVEPEGPHHISPNGKKRYSLDCVPERKDRWKIRSRTFQGIADALADQYGRL